MTHASLFSGIGGAEIAAWVPEVAYEIFRMIQEVENGTDEQQD